MVAITDNQYENLTSPCNVSGMSQRDLHDVGGAWI